ncbi:MAG TPA: hypothetical protein VGH98_08360 [Gemmatimonadaceae bacterium]|jgi:pimeloyl-ACP methyl ester carboxylesterase
MLAAIDGTGPVWDDVYQAKMQHSFLHQIVRRAPGAINAMYYRGPDWSGTDTVGNLIRPETVVQDVCYARERGDKTVFLAGYSRGGAIAIDAAMLLARTDIRVDAMFLFDAVDRSVDLRGGTIPDNVRYAYHAVRMKSTSSRETFGNCGLKINGLGELMKQEFYTTHGGMGGVPWGDAGIEAQVRQQVGFISCEPAPSIRLPDGRLTAPSDPVTILSHQRSFMRPRARIDEGFIDGFTDVTVEQEKRGMEQVRTWMWWQLWKHGVLA